MSLPIEVAIVNYGTPHLTQMAVWSLHSMYPALRIGVLENNSPGDSADQLQALASAIPPLSLVISPTNVHHGPGLDLLIRRAQAPWVLVFDSDCIAYRAGFLEAMVAQAEAQNAYAVGHHLLLNEFGFPGTTASTHPYIHPKCALIHRETYLTLPPFAKHGAPCLANALAAEKQGLQLSNFPVDAYVFHIGRGTVAQHGYQLGLGGKFHHLRALWRKIRG